VEVNLFSGKFTTLADYRLVHGILMIISWAFLVGISTHVARYLKNIGDAWFQLHRAINIIAMLLIIVSFILIVYTLKTFDVSYHQMFGLVVILGALVQPIIGTVANSLFNPERATTPFWPDKLHWWIGRGTVLLATVNIFLGFCEYEANRGVWAAFVIWILICIALYIYSEVRLGSIHHDSAVKAHPTPAGGVWNNNKHGIIVFSIYVFLGIVMMIIINSLLANLPKESICGTGSIAIANT